MEEVIVLNRFKEKEEGSTLDVISLRTGSLVSSFSTPSRFSLNLSSICAISTSIVASSVSPKRTLMGWKWGSEGSLFLSAPSENITSIVLSNDQKFVFGGSETGHLYVWYSQTGQLLNSWKGHYRSITALAVSNDDNQLISGSEDALVHCWNISDVIYQKKSGNLVDFTMNGHGLPITNIETTSHLIISTSLDQSCKIWNATNGQLIYSKVFPGDGLTALTIGKEQTQDVIYVGTKSGRIYSFNIASTEPQEKYIGFLGHEKEITGLHIGELSNSLISTSKDGSVRIWDRFTGQNLKTHDSNKKPVLCSFVLAKKTVDRLSRSKNPTVVVAKLSKSSKTEIEPYILKVLNKPKPSSKLKHIQRTTNVLTKESPQDSSILQKQNQKLKQQVQELLQMNMNQELL